MPHADLILAIDNGTQSVRALLFDQHGQRVAKTQVALHYQRDNTQCCEQDADYFWQQVCAACQQLWSHDPSFRDRIAAVTLTTQRATVVALDAQFRPLRPAISWMDQRRCHRAAPIGGWWPWLFRLAGVSDTIKQFQRDCEAAWMKENEPQVYARIAHYGLLSSYLSLRFTGQWRDSVAHQVGYLPFDFKAQAWAADWDWKWRACAIARHWLPELVACGDPLGTISAAASAATGIPAGVALYATGADKAAEVVGSGCVSPQHACLSYGTTATVNLATTTYFEPQRFLPAYPAAMAGAWNAEFQIYRGYWMVSWFRDQFGHPEKFRAEQGGGVPEHYFDELVQAVAAGSDGLMLQPYWSPGVRDPGPEARGAVIGWSDHHTRAHLYRAILEGIAYGLRAGLERMERRCGQRASVLRVAGGGSQSDGAMQITADIFNRPTERMAEFEASGLGAAITTAVALGWYTDYASAIAGMTRVARRFEPQPHTAQHYEALYTEVYQRLYRRLKPLYQRLHRLNHEHDGGY